MSALVHNIVAEALPMLQFMNMAVVDDVTTSMQIV